MMNMQKTVSLMGIREEARAAEEFWADQFEEDKGGKFAAQSSPAMQKYYKTRKSYGLALLASRAIEMLCEKDPGAKFEVTETEMDALRGALTNKVKQNWNLVIKEGATEIEVMRMNASRSWSQIENKMRRSGWKFENGIAVRV